MKREFGVALIIGMILLLVLNRPVVAAKHYPDYPMIQMPANPLRVAQIKRGKYLTELGDCIACHTQKGGKAFAGGRSIKTPFGIIYTPNLTPDKATGIGRWTNKQFIRAMHQGISPKGQYYYPAFPYLYYSKITAEDLLAIKAYLAVIPPVRNRVAKSEMMLPLNWRFLQFGWRKLFFKVKKDKFYYPNEKKSALWNRGKYLVDGLGHCSMCHTPSHLLIFKKWALGAPIKKRYLRGAFYEGFFAPDITSDNFKSLSVQALSDVFLRDQLIGGGEVIGAMKEVNHDSLKYLSANDIRAVVAYLKNIKHGVPIRIHRHTIKALYHRHCMMCHGSGVGGAPKVGDAKAWRVLVKQGLATLYEHTLYGIRAMPPKGGCSSCSVSQIQQLVRYMAHGPSAHSREGRGAFFF